MTPSEKTTKLPNYELLTIHNYNAATNTATCKKCGIVADVGEFRTPHKKGVNSKYLYYDYCKECHRAGARESRYKRLYNITIEEYDKILEYQGGVCAICLEPPKGNRRFAVDHCHRTGLIRGLLCWQCNRAIGSFYDRQELMWTAFVYLFTIPAAQALGEERYGVVGKAKQKKLMKYGGPDLKTDRDMYRVNPAMLMQYLISTGTQNEINKMLKQEKTKIELPTIKTNKPDKPKAKKARKKAVRAQQKSFRRGS